MNDLIKQYKQDYLVGLKDARKKIEAKETIRKNQIYSEKKIAVNEKCEQVDKAYQAFVQDENAKLNEKIELKKQAVDNEKAKLNDNALKESEIEARAEVSLELDEIDKEIQRVEAEIGG